MTERLTEEEISTYLADADRYVGGEGYLTVGQAATLILLLSQALRHVREDLEHAHHMRAVYDGENQESLRLLRVAEAERDAARAHADERERYWHGLSALMIEAGAESGDSEHLVRSLIRQRDAAREQVAALAEAADDYLHQRLGHGPRDVGVAAQRLDDVLANLPAAVQRHLARDQAAERFFSDLEQHFLIYGYEKVHYIKDMLAAYHAASKEE